MCSAFSCLFFCRGKENNISVCSMMKILTIQKMLESVSVFYVMFFRPLNFQSLLV